jgi:hypothetical protein
MPETTTHALRVAERTIEACFHAVFDRTDIGIVLIDRAGRIELANPAMQRLLGYDSRELCGMRFCDCVHPDEQAAAARCLETLPAGEDRARFEQRCCHRDGHVLWVSVQVALVETTGRDDLMVCAVEDITRFKQAEERLRLHSDILQNMTDWVTATDLEGRITYVSPSVRHVLGYSPEELIGRQMSEVYVQGQVTLSQHLENLHDDNDQELRGEKTYLTRDGRQIVVSLHTSAIENAAGKTVGLISVARDITARKKVEKALEIANEKLQRKNDKLAELTETAHRFVDNVSHEFRTPLTVIKEFTSILSDGLGGPVTCEQSEYLRIIGDAVQDLAQMVDDLLDTSRLKAGTLRVDRRRCGVGEILRSVRPMLENRAAAKNISLIDEIAPDVDDVFADREKAARALINLAINAIKFSPEGSQVTIRAAEGDDGRVEIGVTDQGPGLSKDDLNVIFERFTQVGDTVGARAKGFGLGLSIAKDLIWLNLGRVRVDSEPGRGSTFCFALPRYDWRDIVRSYFDQLLAGEEETVVSALEVRPSHGEECLDHLRGFLISTCRPMDLILGNGRQGRLILLGRTKEPHDWAERLLGARVESAKGDPLLVIPEFRATAIGAWRCPGESDEAVSSVLHLLPEEVDVAKEGVGH